jgi:hypothetical protein
MGALVEPKIVERMAFIVNRMLSLWTWRISGNLDGRRSPKAVHALFATPSRKFS